MPPVVGKMDVNKADNQSKSSFLNITLYLKMLAVNGFFHKWIFFFFK